MRRDPSVVRQTRERSGSKRAARNNGERLEGDVFVVDFGAGRIVDVAAGLVEVVGTAATGADAGGHAFAAATEHSEIVGDNFETGSFLPFLVLPFAGLDATFDEDERTFLQILLSDFGLLTPNNNFVPLGALLALTVTVFVGFVGGNGKISDGLTAGGETRFGIATETAHEDHFVY